MQNTMQNIKRGNPITEDGLTSKELLMVFHIAGSVARMMDTPEGKRIYRNWKRRKAYRKRKEEEQCRGLEEEKSQNTPVNTAERHT